MRILITNDDGLDAEGLHLLRSLRFSLQMMSVLLPPCLTSQV